MKSQTEELSENLKSVPDIPAARLDLFEIKLLNSNKDRFRVFDDQLSSI